MIANSKLFFFLGTIFYFLSTYANAVALTYKVKANEQACFYTDITKPNTKVSFYFAVQSGGSFDIDFKVLDPESHTILSGEKERQGDFIFSATQVGEYRACFINEMSTFSDKMVDFEFSIEDELPSSIPYKAEYSEHNILENSINGISNRLSIIQKAQKEFKTREARNFATVKSTESRIFLFSFVEVLLMVTMSLLQVFIVKLFFTGPQKGF